MCRFYNPWPKEKPEKQIRHTNWTHGGERGQSEGTNMPWTLTRSSTRSSNSTQTFLYQLVFKVPLYIIHIKAMKGIKWCQQVRERFKALTFACHHFQFAFIHLASLNCIPYARKCLKTKPDVAHQRLRGEKSGEGKGTKHLVKQSHHLFTLGECWWAYLSTPMLKLYNQF